MALGLARAAGGIAAIVGFACTGSSASASAQLDYMLECQGCHLSDGRGSPGAVPPLADSVARFLAVPGGREYLVRVPGVAQSPLADSALADVLNWVVARFGPGEFARGAAPYTAGEVSAFRRKPLIDVEARRAQLLRALEASASETSPARLQISGRDEE